MALIVFLLANKVYSPQYDLWLVPLLVLVRVTVPRWLVLTVIGGIMFLVVFSRVPHSPLLRTYTVGTLGLVRAAAELALFRYCWRRSDEHHPDRLAAA
jgi:hypothetical protein